MKSIYLYLTIFVCCLEGIALADAVTLEETIFESDLVTPIDQSKLLTVHFIDVGGGDAILIDTPSDKKILIDGGWTWGDRAKARKEYQAYLDRFLENDIVDLIIITHPDYDHFAGIDHVLDRYVVKQIWYNGYDSNELSSSWRDLINKIDSNDDLLFVSPLEYFIGLGSVIRFDDSNTFNKSDDVVLTLINTKRWVSDEAYGSGRHIDEARRRNSSSIVVRLDFGNTSFLFTGDTNGREKDSQDVNECEDQELFMVDNNENVDNPLHEKLDTVVLKVPHHGSDGSSSLCFLKAAKPEWAVISAGVHHGHPHSPVLNRLKRQDVGLSDAHILRTDDDEDSDGTATELNLGDDCYQFLVVPTGIVRIEKWNVHID